jgi:hypothetical protein
MTSSASPPDFDYGEKERADVQRQLDRMLENSHFSNSKRFPSFLRFIVQEKLEGRGGQLKERTLGIEVFGRDPEYDTTSDPIVRVTAAEIRKRIAQYYQDAARPDELRLSLPPGSYIPHFEWPKPPSLTEAVQPLDESLMTKREFSTPSAPQSAKSEAMQTPAAASRWSASWLLVCAALLIVVLAGGWSWIRSRPTTLDLFWSPVLNSDSSIVVCFPQSSIDGITLRDAADPLQQRHLLEKMNGVVADDLQPLVSLSGLLDTRHQRYNLMGEEAATLTDLRQGPTIFIGAFDNAWTLRLTRGLRFRFGNDPQMTQFWIEDTHSSSKTRWGVDRNVQQTTNNYRDYAIVARFRDANTGQLAVVAAGIARGGTVAAGEFLTQAGDMDSIRSQAPPDWAGQNMEFVLSTEIIDGKSSPPKIEATYFW